MIVRVIEMIRFRIPIQWMMTAEVEVMAPNREEAIRLVLAGALPVSPAACLYDSVQVSEDEEAIERASLLSTEPLEPSRGGLLVQQYPDADPKCISTLVAWGKHAPNCSCAIRASVPGEVIKPRDR